MFYMIFRIIEKILIIYFTAYLLIDIGLFAYSLYVFRRRSRTSNTFSPTEGNGIISIIVPAYNEEVSIVDCLHLLLRTNYPQFEIIAVNDGSTDRSLEQILQSFDLEELSREPIGELNTKLIRGTYRGIDLPLTIIDKENGGKADAINAGLNYAKGKYICTVDADSILDPNALAEAVQPFMDSEEVIVSGGQLAASNGLTLVNGQVVRSEIPSNIWVLWQIIEYIKSFMVSRIGLSRINALLIMSGAFSLFRKSDLLDIGGFLTPWNDHPYILKTLGAGHQTVCEDMEVVLRLYRYRKDHKRTAQTRFLPRPVCWTEVPDNARNLFRQRSRWHQGLAESLKLHRGMIFEPTYGATGLLGLPYYFFFEMLAPLVKLFTLLFVFFVALLGIINYKWVLLLLISVILFTAIITSSITAMVESWSYSQRKSNRQALRYKNFTDWMWLIVAGILGEFTFSLYKLLAQLDGFWQYLRKRSNWKKIDRKGVDIE